MAGPAATFDPDNNEADAEFLRTFRAPPTPRSERPVRRFDDAWAHVPTPALARQLTAALAHRVMPATHACPDAGLAGLSLLEMGRMLLKRRGIPDLTRDRIAALSLRSVQSYLVTDDFVSVLLNLARR
jgi:hypothetical protein